jgi:hypothetical protein
VQRLTLAQAPEGEGEAADDAGPARARARTGDADTVALTDAQTMVVNGTVHVASDTPPSPFCVWQW